MTNLLFRDNTYLKTTTARVINLSEKEGVKGVITDRTIFYATSGGQPGDVGHLEWAGKIYKISTAIYNENKEIVHILEGTATPAIGAEITLTIDWNIRYARMKMHTGLHLLSVVLPYPVTGGSIGATESRLDFDIPDSGQDKDSLTEQLNALIAKNAAISERWITDAELESNPSLVKTMSVKPPMGSGKVRLVEIEGLDLQPCGGTHVKNTSEIGRLIVSAIEKKGKQNRRVRIIFG